MKLPTIASPCRESTAPLGASPNRSSLRPMAWEDCVTNNFDERHIGYLPANKVAAEKTAQAKTNKRLLSESPPTNTVMSTVDGARLVQDMEQQIRDGGAAGDVFTTPFEVRYVQCKIKRNGTIKSCSAKSGQMQYGTIPAPGGSGCSALINHLVGPV